MEIKSIDYKLIFQISLALLAALYLAHWVRYLCMPQKMNAVVIIPMEMCISSDS